MRRVATMARDGLLGKPLFSLTVFLCLGAVIAAGVYTKMEASREAVQWVEHTHEILHRTNRLDTALHAAESAQRGHAASGHDAFVKYYRHYAGTPDAPGSIDRELAVLQELVRDNQEQSVRLNKVTDMIARKRAYMNEVLQASMSEKPQAPTTAQRMIANGDGLRLMDDIQRNLREFRDREAELLRERQEHLEYFARINAWTLLALTLLLVAVMIGGARAIRRQFIQRQQAERQLLLTMKFQHALLHNASYAIVAGDANGLVTLFNNAAEELTGYTAEEVVGKETAALWHDKNEMAAHAQHLAAQLGREVTDDVQVFHTRARMQGSEQREWTFVRKDGTRVPVWLSVTAVHDDQGQINGFLGIAQDISARKEVEMMKNEFISTVSHELRTPLTSIRGALGLVTGSMSDALPENVRQLIAIAHKNSERLVRLINNILDIEKIEAGRMVFESRALDVDEVVRHSVEEMRGLAQKTNITLTVTDLTDGGQVMGDEDRLLQVLGNLLSNAIKYSPAGGTIRITAREKGEHICLAVEDEGPGIPDEFKSRIFSKFAQADSSDSRQKAGTGLGLSISKAIVESMHGTIGFDSEPGRTVFHVLLPRSYASAPLPVAPDSARKILIVEDDEDIAHLLKLSLEQEGFHCDLAATGAQARAKLAQQAYLAMTLDLALPDEDGLSLIRELRQREATIDLPIVVVSANAEAGRKKLNGDAVGILGWLPKPIDLDRLKRLLSGLTEESRLPEILYIEDEEDIITLISTALEGSAIVQGAGSLKEARHWLERRSFDLAILDVYLPDGLGFDLLPDLSSRPKPIPIIILSVAETPHEIQQKVMASLVKSVTPEDRIIETIKSLIRRKEAL